MKRDEMAGPVPPRENRLDPVGGPFPVVTLLLVLANAILFAFQLAAGESSDYGIRTWGLTPARLLDFPASGLQPVLTLLTSVFLHAGFRHLYGNMIFLAIFGRGVERAMGPARFLGFYLIAGILPAMVQVFTASQPDLPHVGASGAVSGVLGGFLLLFPFRPMSLLALTAIHPALLGLFLMTWLARVNPQLLRIPAFIYLLPWFGIQIFGSTATQAQRGGSIDFLAHVAGFAVGALLVIPFTGANYRRAVRMPDSE